MAILNADPLGVNNPAYAVSESAYATAPHVMSRVGTQAFETDFIYPAYANNAVFPPWTVTNNSAGTPTYSNSTSTADHPGIALATGIGANTGCNILMPAATFLPAGGEYSEMCFQLGVLAGSACYFGFLNSTTTAYAQPTVGAWINILAGVVSGSCGQASVTTTATTYTLTAATWYRATIANNATNTGWTFSLYTAAIPPVLLWQQTVTLTPPTAALNHGVVQSNSTGSAAILSIDYMAAGVTRALNR